MNQFETLIKAFEFNRARTLAILQSIDEDPHHEVILGWRPADGRAHIGWQLMHIGVSEEIFATERLAPKKPGAFTELWPRFRGGSTPDDDIPSVAEIRQVLTDGRTHFLATLDSYPEDALEEIPPTWSERGLTLREIVHLLIWHEAHHQGQAHLTLNLYRGRSLSQQLSTGRDKFDSEAMCDSRAPWLSGQVRRRSRRQTSSQALTAMVCDRNLRNRVALDEGVQASGDIL